MQAFVTASPVSHMLALRSRARFGVSDGRPAAAAAAAAAARTTPRRGVARMSYDVRGSSRNPYRIAVLPGDGAGPAVAEAVKKVLNALAADADLHFDFVHAPYGADAFETTGSLVTEETLDICRSADAVLRSYQGTARGIGADGSAHLQLRDRLGLFAQFRPVIVYPQLRSLSTLRPDVVSDVDIMLVREISAGALGEMSTGVKGEQSSAEMSYTEDQVAAIASAALDVAEHRSGRILNVDKADVLAVSRFWRRVLHETIDRAAAGNDGIQLSDMYVDDFVRQVIHRPTDFDVVITSNLFGDICAEVIDALAGPQRLSPSFWKSRDGLGVYGPADIYNMQAYPKPIRADARNADPHHSADADADAAAGASAVALTRAASMMLRYELDEPAAANTIQQALRKTMADMADDASAAEEAADVPGSINAPVSAARRNNGNGATFSLSKAFSAASADEYADTVVRSMQLLRQFEQVCDPTECGE